MVQLLWKILWRFLKKLKIELPYDPAIPFLGICSKELKSGPQRGIYTHLFFAILFTIAKMYKQPNVHQWINGSRKCVSYYTHNRILALKKKAILPFVTTWMNLDDSKLSEISHKRINITWFFLYEEPTIVRLLEAKSKMVVARGCKEGKFWVACQQVWRFSHARWKSSRDLQCNIMSGANSTVFIIHLKNY